MLPAADEALTLLERARVFTNLDARSGFWQVPVHKDYGVEHIHHTRGRLKLQEVGFGCIISIQTFPKEELSAD